jgi:hypothetical protein
MLRKNPLDYSSGRTLLGSGLHKQPAVKIWPAQREEQCARLQ